jgi:ribosomal protein L11 methyltransferase
MKNAPPELWQVHLTVPTRALEACQDAFDGFAESVSWFLENPMDDEDHPDSLWRLQGIRRGPLETTGIEIGLALTMAAQGVPVSPVRFERVAETDWLAANLRDFPPIRAGRFFVHGSHYQGPVPPAVLPLEVDAGTAFGSGEHATTQGCLLAIDALLRARRFARVLDLGCGSGILAMALAKAGCRRVLAADIDPAAVAVAAANAKTNGVATRVHTCISAGYRSVGKHLASPYDLIVANILARPLVSMAASLERHLGENGVAVLSGLLYRQERLVLSAHRQQGLSLAARVRINGWSSLVLVRRPASAPSLRLSRPAPSATPEEAAPAHPPASMAD